MRDAMDRIADDITSVKIGKRCKPEVSSTLLVWFPRLGGLRRAHRKPNPARLRTYIQPNAGHGRAGPWIHQMKPKPSPPSLPKSSPVATKLGSAHLDHQPRWEHPRSDRDVPKGGEPEDNRIFWMYDRGPDGSNWYLYELFLKATRVHHDRQRKHGVHRSSWSRATAPLTSSPRTPRAWTKGSSPSALRTVGCLFNNGKVLASIPIGQHHRQFLKSNESVTIDVFWTTATSLAPLRKQERQIGEAHDPVSVEIRF